MRANIVVAALRSYAHSPNSSMMSNEMLVYSMDTLNELITERQQPIAEVARDVGIPDTTLHQ